MKYQLHFSTNVKDVPQNVANRSPLINAYIHVDTVLTSCWADFP